MIQGYLITAGATALIAFSAGWVVKTWNVDSDEKTKLETQREAHRIELIGLQDELDENNRERLRMADELADAKTNVRTVTRELIKEVPRYVSPSTPTCDRSFSVDAVRLLNSAARGSFATTESGQSATRHGAGELSAILADVTRRNSGTLAGGYPRP